MIKLPWIDSLSPFTHHKKRHKFCFVGLKCWKCRDLCTFLGVKSGLTILVREKIWHFATLDPCSAQYARFPNLFHSVCVQCPYTIFQMFLQIWSLVIRKQENNPLLLWIILFLLIFIKLQGWLLVLTTFFALWGIYRKRLIVFFDFMPNPSIHVTSRSLYVRQDCHLVWSESHGLAIKVNIQHII